MNRLQKRFLKQTQQILCFLLLVGLLTNPALAARTPVEVAQTFQGHRNVTAGATYSPDGQTIAVASGAYIHVLKAYTGETLKVLTGPQGEINRLFFSPDGKTIFGSSWNEKQVWVWDVKRGTLLKGFTDTQQITVLALSPDGSLMVTGSNQNNEAKVWDVSSGKILQVLKGHNLNVRAALFMSDETVMTTGDDQVIAWNPRTAEPRFKLKLAENARSSSAMAISSDGKLLAVAITFNPANQVNGTIDRVKVYNLSTRQEVFTVEPVRPILCVSIAPNSNIMAICGSTTIKLYDLTSLALVQTLNANGGPINSMSFSPNGNNLAASNKNGTLKIWTLNNPNPFLDVSPTGNTISVSALSPDGQWLATGGNGPDIKLWNAQTGKLIQTLKEPTIWISTLTFSWDSKVLITGSMNGLKLWEVPSGRLLTDLKASGTTRLSMIDASLSPNGQLLVGASYDTTARIWDLKTGTELNTLVHKSMVSAAAFSPDSQKVATTSTDGSLKLWRVQDGKELLSAPEAYSSRNRLVFSPDGALLALLLEQYTTEMYDVTLTRGQSNYLLKVYKTDTLQRVLSMPVSSPAVQFGKNNTLLLGSPEDCKMLQQIDLNTQKVLQEFALSNCAGDFTVSKDGRQLTSTYGQTRDASSATLYEVKGQGQVFLQMPDLPVVAAVTPVPLENSGTSKQDQNPSGSSTTSTNPPSSSPPTRPASQPTPDIKILSPATGTLWSREQIPVLLTSSQEGMTYQVYMDGTLQTSKAIGVSSSKNQTLIVRLPAGLQDGQNIRITVVGQTADGQQSAPVELNLKWKSPQSASVPPATPTTPQTTSAPAAPVASTTALPATQASTGTRKLWVLTVGVGSFESPRITPLNFAAKDANDFARFWATQKGKGKPFDDVEVTTLTDQKASRRNVVTALTRILEEADGDDTVIWFFSTHGINYRMLYYVTTYDTDISSPAALQATAMDQDQLMGMLRRSSARVWMFLDTCHAGLATGFKEASTSADPLVNSLKAIKVDGPENRQPIIFAATKGNDVAYENSTWSNGAFTKALLEGLSGKAVNSRGEVKVFGLLSYVADRVEELTEGNQHPNVQQTSDNVVMAVP